MSDIGLPVKTDYKATSIDLLYQLIEYSNPGFTAEFPKGTVQFNTPTVAAIVAGDAYKTDTIVNVSSAPGAGKVGNKDIRYRRIDMGVLFKSMVVRITDYYSTNALPQQQWRDSFRAKFGISVPDEDFTTGGGIAIGNTTINIKASSLCYKGSFVLNWTKSGRPVSDVITDANRGLAGRLYPGGNDFTTPGRKQQGEFTVYCIDASEVFLQYPTLVASGTWPSSGIGATLADWLNAHTSRKNWNVGQHTVEGGLTGLSFFKYTIPNSNVPEANSAKYNRVLVLQSVATSWFEGKIIIHWNE